MNVCVFELNFYDDNLHIYFREQIVFIQASEVYYVDAVESTLPLSSDISNPEFEYRPGSISTIKVLVSLYTTKYTTSPLIHVPVFKGCLLIRMMENFLTTKTFYQGLRQYFKVCDYLDTYRETDQPTL